MRIAIGGIMHESNTFLPLVTTRRHFKEGSLTYGDDVVRAWGAAHHEMAGFIAGAKQFGYELAPTAMAWATPAGPVDDEVLDDVVRGIIAGCRGHAPDGLLVALHGAMVTARHPSADTEVLCRLRTVFPRLPIMASLDYHGNVSIEMGAHADALVGYQTYPHVDQKQCGLKAAELMARTVRGEIKPICAVSKPPMILNLLGQDTSREPMVSLLNQAREAERRRGMLSVSIMAGFPYADTEPMGPSVIAVADQDQELAQRVADELAREMWRVRHDLYVPCPQPQEGVHRALIAEKRPVVLVDLGDNIGGGSAGDGTVLLSEILRQGGAGAVVPLYAPDAVQAAVRAGVTGAFERDVGGAVDRLHGEPVHVKGIVRLLHDGKWVETEARHGGRRDNDQGLTAVIEIEGPNTLVLNSLRTPPFSLGQLTSLGIDPRQARILVVKAAVAYKAAYAPLNPYIIEVDTPGLTAVNFSRFNYQHIRRPMFPLDGV
jgi:microcystin degradation protein MlrC